MSVKKIFVILTLCLFSVNVFAVTPRSTGKYKNWESFIAETDKGKICFAQTIPTKRAPAAGKRRYSFFSQKDFAWLLDDQEEKKFIQLMKKATDIIVKARTTKGAETTDHYSMMGFTKAYNTAKKTCS